MIDVIVSWPRSCDYPAWRQFIRDERHRFGEVFVVFTELPGKDISGFVRANFPEATFIDSPATHGRDWRDVAVNAALDRSTASHVWFTEQDFEITDPEVFWPQLTGDVAGVHLDDRRYHPACLLVSRSLVETSGRHFGTDPYFGDHFGRVAYYLFDEPSAKVIIGGYRHFQAISESQMLAWQGQPPKFRPEQFREWVDANVAADVPIEPNWLWAVA